LSSRPVHSTSAQQNYHSNSIRPRSQSQSCQNVQAKLSQKAWASDSQV